MADIQIVTDKEDIKICLNLRRIVFIDEQSVPEHEEVDGEDGRCTHILAKIDGKPVGAARFQYISESSDIQYAKIQRVCVLPEARGKGLGAEIITCILACLKDEKRTHNAVLGAQLHALAFYEKLGFEAYGPQYLDAGILHRDMQISL